MQQLENILEFYREIGATFLEKREPTIVRRDSPPESGTARRMVPQQPPNPNKELEAVHQEIYRCTRCELHQSNTNYVPGEGSIQPGIMFIGEGPGEEEDKLGRPFVGKAGQLLDRIIEKMGYKREDVFIGNIVKCRPPGNRDPHRTEVEACLPYLKRQVEILKPRIIVCLGRVALNNLLDGDYPITKVRGQVFEYHGIPVIPTFHPSYILHQQTQEKVSKAKWDVWHDMMKVLELIKKV